MIKGSKHSDETREKLSAARQTRPSPSEETRQRISAAGVGRKHSDETKVLIGFKISQAAKRPNRKPRKSVQFSKFVCKACNNPFEAKSSRALYCTMCFPNQSARNRGYRLGITELQFQALLQRHDFKCAICNCELSVVKCKDKAFANVDHDHVTLKIRGILCSRCNLLLSALDNDEWLQRAQTYLRNYGSDKQEANSKALPTRDAGAGGNDLNMSMIVGWSTVAPKIHDYTGREITAASWEALILNCKGQIHTVHWSVMNNKFVSRKTGKNDARKIRSI